MVQSGVKQTYDKGSKYRIEIPTIFGTTLPREFFTSSYTQTFAKAMRQNKLELH